MTTYGAHDAVARVLIDGAHVPGHLPLHVPATGADWYVANCHKWLFAPRACGFLWASVAVQDLVYPLSMSHGYGHGMTAEFDWTGTQEPTTYLSVPAAIDFHERLGGRALMARNAGLAFDMGLRLAGIWGTDVAAPEEMCGSMAAIHLLDGCVTTAVKTNALRRWLSTERHIEIALGYHASAAWLRIAAQAHNEPADYDRLAEALVAYRK